jgi:hypothetical protein
MKVIRLLMVLSACALLATGCSQDTTPVSPENGPALDKNGTETLGPPSIEIADGACFAQGGVGMVGATTGTLNIDVPAGTINQVLLYWAGGTTGAPGDANIKIDGYDVTGELIGGPAYFYTSNTAYYFSSYRADITGLELVSTGANSFTISDFDFDNTGGNLDENCGVGMMVIYDDGTTADLQLVDGLDLAFYQFDAPRDATVPQTFTFPAEDADRYARMVIFAGSVGFERPNGIKFTTTAGDDLRSDLLGSTDGLLWDTLCLTDILIPAGSTWLTVELISTPVANPLGASLCWVGAGLALPTTPEPEPACIGDFVWHDLNQDGIQDMDEPGVEGVVVHLMDCAGQMLAETMTDADGWYAFCELTPGDYSIHFVLPDGWAFSPQDQGGDDAKDSDADTATGLTACTTLDPGENDWTWDAGIWMIPQDGCSHTIGYWKTHAGLGPQDDVVTPLLPQWLGDAGGAKSIAVTTNIMAVDLLTLGDPYGPASNGISKLYAQLLGVKLSIADGASDADVADAIAEADAFLAMYDWMDWGELSRADKNMVLAWMEMFDDYNNGLIGPGHCDEVEDTVKTLRAPAVKF